jgi:hypothetical protein
VNRITLENELLMDINIRIGEIGSKAVAIFTNVRTKKQRPCTVQPEDQARQVSGIFVKKPFRTGRKFSTIAALVGDEERIVGLQCLGLVKRSDCCGWYVERACLKKSVGG